MGIIVPDIDKRVVRYVVQLKHVTSAAVGTIYMYSLDEISPAVYEVMVNPQVMPEVFKIVFPAAELSAPLVDVYPVKTQVTAINNLIASISQQLANVEYRLIPEYPRRVWFYYELSKILQLTLEYDPLRYALHRQDGLNFISYGTWRNWR